MKKLWYKKKSSLHGSGLFAVSNIKKGDQVIQYIGDKVTKKEGDRRADIQLKKAEKNKRNTLPGKPIKQKLQTLEKILFWSNRFIFSGN